MSGHSHYGLHYQQEAATRRPPRPQQSNGHGEALVLLGADIARLLEPWAAAIDTLAEKSKGQGRSVGKHAKTPTLLSASASLAAWTGYDQGRMRDIIDGRTNYVVLSRADYILTLAEMGDLIGGPELPIYRNPALSERKYRALMHKAGADADDYEWPPKRSDANGDT